MAASPIKVAVRVLAMVVQGDNTEVDGAPSLQPEDVALWGLAFLVGSISLVFAGATNSRQILVRVIISFGALAGGRLEVLRTTAR